MSGLGHVQKLVLGLCTIHRGRISINKIAWELDREPSQIAKVALKLEERGLLIGLKPIPPTNTEETNA